MAPFSKPIPEDEPRILTSRNAKGGKAAARTSAAASMLCPALMACVVPLLVARSLTAAALAVALVVAVAAAAALGALSSSRAQGAVRLAAGCAVAFSLAAMLAIPGAYAPLIAQTGLVAGDIVFAVCLGLVSAAAAWFVTRLRSSGATLLLLVPVCSVSVRLSLGLSLAGSCIGVASWLLQCRWQQLRGSSYSASTLAMSMSVGVIGCCGIFFACAMLWSPSAAVSEAHDAMRGVVDEVRFGAGSVPEGDMAAAAKMNEGDGVLTVSFDGTVSNDVLLRGFVGATYEYGAWSALDHNAYEGEWAHMSDWLSSMGMPCAAQRAAFDDTSDEAGQAARPNTVGVRVDASQTRSRYLYVPYTLRELSDTGVPFAEWLFGEARAGNSASFATAAVLAFRSQGIPARYAEGYRATQADIARSVEAGEPLKLTSEDVHAWAEVHLDGIGWTPVEVTPGFYAQSLEADSVIDVAEAKSSGSDNDVLQSGSVSGQVDSESDEEDEPLPDLQPAQIALASALVLASLCVAVVAAAYAQRAIRIRRRNDRIESDDQEVSVLTLCRYLSAVMASAVPSFDERNPLECSEGFERAFPHIDVREYRRAIMLYQRYTFGARSLKPHEMRTLRRFGERLRNEMTPAKTASARLRRTFVDAL